MIDWLTITQIWLGTLVGILLLGMGVFKRKPSRLSLGLLALVEIALVGQLIVSLVEVFAGARAATDTVEFFAYLFVALVVPLGAGFWASIEKTRWSTMVLGLAALTIAVMLVRMQQIWLG